jgi:translocation and assembly module TamB
LSAPDDIPPPDTVEAEGAVPAVLKRSALPKAITAVAVTILVVLLAVVATTRYGVLIPQVRLLIEARTDGLKIGRLGKLKIEGLSGDVWRDVGVRRLTLRDEKGVWLEANNVHLSWRYAKLLQRRFEAERLDAQSIRVIRRPTLSPKTKDRGLPVSFDIDQAHARLLLEPAFSYVRGDYDLDLTLDVERRGGRSGRLKAASRLHPGDHLDLDFAAGRTGPMRLVADAEEARGGALAGALGFAPDQPFKLDVRAGGTNAKGGFTALARTGATTPLAAQGQWTPQGGQAGGRIQLSASALTRPLAARLGAELRFGIAGRKAGAGIYALDAKVRSDALNAHAWGYGDLGKRTLSPGGVRLDAQAASLSRITGGPKSGAARASGVVTGTWSAWRFAGSAAVADVEAGGYGLARVSGPVELARGKTGYALKAKLAGAGGRGTGFAAAILGGAPSAVVDAERLKGGQLLLRHLDVAGRGLKVQASGGRSLLGAVTVKGRADVSNLAAAGAGASGAAAMTWQASQARGGAPWSFTLDAKGERFATGLAELDRLLGGKPRLQMQANWQAGRLAVAKATLEGAAVNASTAGVLDKGTLAFKADWNASGPFRAGPVEISGKARGTGGVTGTLSAPRLDLLADIDQLDVPRLPLKDARLSLTFQRQADGASGVVAVTATSAYGPAKGKSDFRFPEGGVDLSNLSLDAGGLKAAGSLSLRRNRPSAADLTVEVVRGAFLDGGRVAGTARITDAAGGARAVLDLHGENVPVGKSAVTVRTVRLAANGPLAHLPFSAEARGASGQGAWSLSGKGVLNDADPGYLATFDGMGTLGGRDLHTTETAAFRFGGDTKSARVRLAGSDGGRLDLDGVLKGDDADVQAKVAGMGLNLFDSDFDGRIDATLSLRGRGADLSGVVDARLNGARGKGTPANQGVDGTLKGRLAGDTLTLDVATSNAQGLKANANLVLPAEASAAPFRVAIARQRPMRGRFFAEGEVRPLWDLAVGGERALSGQVRTEGTVSGTLARPKAVGTLAMEKGRFDDGGTACRCATSR